MPEGAAVAVLMCVLVIGIAFGTLIGAVFLRAAIALYNKLAGGASSPSSVPEPAFGKAMWITFATFVAQVVVGLLINGLVVGDRGAAAETHGLIAQLISFPVSVLIMAGMLSARLPTTFGRAFLVTLCDMLLSLLAAVVLLGVAVLVFAGALSGSWP
jgi:hypothetical protein